MTSTNFTLEQKIEMISDNIGSRFLSLAKLLREIQEEDTQLFLKAVKLSPVGVRKAYALARISRQFDGLNIPEERLYYVGWTKLQIIGRHLNDTNAEQLLQLAAAHTAHDLESKLRGELPVKNARVVQFYLASNDYEHLHRVLIKHGAVENGRGLIFKEEALVSLLTAQKAIWA